MRLLAIISILLLVGGCSAFPDIAHQPLYHNPFPQISRVAVLPFFNQSAEPTVDQDQIALAYYNELQQIPGFEVVPVGVTKRYLETYQAQLQLQQVAANSTDGQAGSTARLPAVELTSADFPKLARMMDVDAIVVGSVTEYSAYYPPRMGLAVRWYAANPGFHPIPPGYGLPWGTPEEEFIPESLVYDAEFALAKEQLKTQTPPMPIDPVLESTASPVQPAADEGIPLPPTQPDPHAQSRESVVLLQTQPPASLSSGELPADWPDPRGFVPPAPSSQRPVPRPQSEPILSHTRIYQGNDAEFTKRLANYFYFRDDGRFGGWQAYLQRTDDFTRFCCHLHITEMLAARGGAGKTQVVWRWPIGRYER